MSQTNAALSQLRLVVDPPVEDSTTPAELETLLTRAAAIAAENGIESESFMSAAWNSYLAARPGLREELEEKELKAQLRKLRKQGLIGTA